MGEQLPFNFSEKVGEHLMRQPVGESVPFGPLADRLIQDANLVWHSQSQTHAHHSLRTSIEQVVIDPLSDFGVISHEDRIKEREWGELKKLLAFKITRFGRNALESLVYPGE